MSTVTQKAYSAFGDLPEDWTRRRLRYDVRLNPKKSSLNMEPDELVSFLPMDAVGEYGGLNLDDVRELADVCDGYSYLADGDICIAKITPCFENGKGALAKGLTNGVGFGTTELHVVRPGPQLDRRFLFYVSIADDFRKLGESEMYGAGGQKRINESFIRDWKLPLPPLNTQRQIAQFLDEKTALIDELIEKKRMLLDLLVEKRQALITRAVTKGLEPGSSMPQQDPDQVALLHLQNARRSTRLVTEGVGGMSLSEWLVAHIQPAGWKIIRLRWLAKLYAGGTPDTKNVEYWEGGTIPWLNSGAVNQCIIAKPSDYISELALKESSAKWIPRGALVIALAGQGKTKAMVGYLDIRTTGNQSLAAIVPERINGKYLYWWLRSQYLTLRNLSSQDGRDGLNLNVIGSILCPVPPPETQRKIARFLDEKTAQIDELHGLIVQSVDNLAEYRSALITAAVTGQLAELQ